MYGEWRYSSTTPDLGVRWEAGWTPEPVWTLLWSKDKFLAPARNQTPAIQPAAHRYID
jgi:hypothetical protein